MALMARNRAKFHLTARTPIIQFSALTRFRSNLNQSQFSMYILNILLIHTQGSPFSMLKSNLSSLSVSSTKEEFEGAAIDILDQLSHILGFSYKIYLSPDGKAGVENPSTGEWNGAIKEIIEKVKFLFVQNYMSVHNLNFICIHISTGRAQCYKLESVFGEYKHPCRKFK